MCIILFSYEKNWQPLLRIDWVQLRLTVFFVLIQPLATILHQKFVLTKGCVNKPIDKRRGQVLTSRIHVRGTYRTSWNSLRVVIRITHAHYIWDKYLKYSIVGSSVVYSIQNSKTMLFQTLRVNQSWTLLSYITLSNTMIYLDLYTPWSVVLDKPDGNVKWPLYSIPPAKKTPITKTSSADILI